MFIYSVVSDGTNHRYPIVKRGYATEFVIPLEIHNPIDEVSCIIIEVFALNRIMYWVSSDTIYTANMDGTGVRVFLRLVNTQLDGMVLDITRDR